ncbi:DNA-directed DNA polymerase [Parasponia andersonii]|uniref:DNA-directed DNA polymerase n=1 Tax=Parasponia andersonii TaxID=3476 RepID=A0A2P5D5M7_PARAD|nr:DNA-directed DNA polymerase [Parasponia andersonii]
MANTTRSSEVIKTSSSGAWQGDNPLNYAFPLLILQTILVLFISRFLAFLLKPLRQPKVIAEILGGILLGPSALGRNQDFLRWIFPSWSTPILESVASIGLLFFLFLVGLELDLTSIRRSGRRAFAIALAGISLPFLFGIGLTFLLRRAIKGEEKVGYAQCLMFTGVALSITAFPVLARILAELRLLTTQVGETAMAAAAINDVAAWILLAISVDLAAGNSNHGGTSTTSPLVSIWVLLSGVLFVAFMLLLVRPFMSWFSTRCSSRQQDLVDETYICLTMAGVMASGFMTDLIGIHSIFGAFVFGLTIPKGGDLAGRLIKRIEDFVSGLLLPLYFACSGLKTDVTKIRGAKAWGLLLIVISTSCAGKIMGTFVVAMLCMIPARESLALGVLMNTKGLVELIVLNIGKEKKVLNDEMFAILVMMALVTTFMTTPTVMAIYKSSSSKITTKGSSNSKSDKEKDCLRILACIHGPGNLPSLLNLMESLQNSRLKLYVMHLVELSDRSSSIIMVQRARKNGYPLVNRFCRGSSTLQYHDQLVASEFKAYSRVHGQVTIRHLTAISALSCMHEDILQVAQAKRVSMIFLLSMEVLGHGWLGVNQRVLRAAPCLVAVFVDGGFGLGSECDREDQELPAAASTSSTAITIPKKRVCVLFLGGPDDRQALELGGWMAQHADFMVTVVRLLCVHHHERNCYSISTMTDVDLEKELDEGAMAELKRRSDVEYIEKVVAEGNIEETVRSIGQSKVYELVIVGKRRLPSSMASQSNQIDQSELGTIGDALVSAQPVISSSVLVIQHQQLLNSKKSSARLLPNTDRNQELSLV